MRPPGGEHCVVVIFAPAVLDTQSQYLYMYMYLGTSKKWRPPERRELLQVPGSFPRLVVSSVLLLPPTELRELREAVLPPV